MKSHATLPVCAVLFLLLASRGCDSNPSGKKGKPFTLLSRLITEPTCSLPTKGLNCCGRKPYDPTTKTCCDTTVWNIPSAESECCSGMAYKKTERQENRCIRQCGQQRVEYNTETQECQQGEVINRDDKNPTTPVVIPAHGLPSPKPPRCFLGRVDPPTKKSCRRKKQECCGLKLYQRLYIQRWDSLRVFARFSPE